MWPPIVIAIFLLLAVLIVAGAWLWGAYSRKQATGEIVTQDPRPPLFPTRNKDRQLQAVVDWLCTMAFEQTGIKITRDKAAYPRVVEVARQAMRDLERETVVIVRVPVFFGDKNAERGAEVCLTREVINELTRYPAQ